MRLTGSVYATSKSINNTLYSGSRAGSRYYYVLENVNATESAQAWSGDLQPGFSRRVRAWVVNPFVKFQGLELFGNIEQAKGRKIVETSDAWITAKVKAAILAEPGLKSLQINVDTKDATVTLSGNVDSDMLRDRAKQIAMSTEGVKNVVDNLSVKTG